MKNNLLFEAFTFLYNFFDELFRKIPLLKIFVFILFGEIIVFFACGGQGGHYHSPVFYFGVIILVLFIHFAPILKFITMFSWHAWKDRGKN